MNIEIKRKYPCPCCALKTMEFEYTNTFQICPICYWEDDGEQFFNPNSHDGANKVSLNQAKLNYLKYGAILEKYIGKTRKPREDEL